jgi:hypothetical protein
LPQPLWIQPLWIVYYSFALVFPNKYHYSWRISVIVFYLYWYMLD